MNTQAIIIIGILLLVIVLSNTAQTIMYNRLRRRHDRLQEYYREKQSSLYLEIDELREKLWYKENKNMPNPTLDMLRPGEPDLRD